MSYVELISRLTTPTVKDVIDCSVKNVPLEFRYSPWTHPEIKHGCGLLMTEGALCSYIAAYGEMHEVKCKSVMRSFPFDELGSSFGNFEVFDWGCGQGMGTICFAEMLRERDKLHYLRKVTLIEPSPSALERASFNVQHFTRSAATIIPINQYLPGDGTNDEIQGINYQHSTVVHIFSNILDVDGINLEKLASLIPDNGHRQFIFCMGPKNTNYYCIDKFTSVFQPQKYLSSISAVGFGFTSTTKKSFSCYAKGFEYNNAPLRMDAMQNICAPTLICGRPILDDYDPMLAVQNSTLTKSGSEFLEKLQTILTDRDFIYIQPDIEGDIPDIVVLRPNIGIFIINIFDYDLRECSFGQYSDEKANYNILVQNEEEISSPVQVLSKYQDNLVTLHMQRTAEHVLQKKGYWSVVKTIGYFPKNTDAQIKDFFKDVDHKYQVLVGNDVINATDLQEFSNRTNFSQNNSLFDSTVKENFIKIVSPGWHSYKEGKNIALNTVQKKLSQSSDVKQKIKGSAGSGKTMVMTHRAVNAQHRSNEKVLMLTFNLSLVNYLRHRMSEVPEDFAWDKFQITNYHQFIKSVANNLDVVLYPGSFENVELFETLSHKLPKYPAIFIDEVQDYKQQWLQILSKCFLKENGELVVFGDSNQNIYKYELDSNGDIKIGVIPGVWNGQLVQSYRFNNGQLTSMSNQFQNEYLGATNAAQQETNNQISFDTICYHTPESVDPISVATLCDQIIKENRWDVKDTVILSQTHDYIRGIDHALHQLYPRLITMTTTESQEDYDELLKKHNNQKESEKLKDDLKALRRTKKYHFRMGQYCLKLSTIHSYKGWESENVILIIENEDPHNTTDFIIPEVIYTGITRAKSNISIIGIGNRRYDRFFRQYKKNE